MVYDRWTVPMEPLQEDVLELSSENRKKRKKDHCLSLERELDQEMLLLDGGKRKNQAAQFSAGGSRSYVHDTSVRKGGTTERKPRVHKQRSTITVLESQLDHSM